jgi:hypothetical protein
MVPSLLFFLIVSTTYHCCSREDVASAPVPALTPAKWVVTASILGDGDLLNFSAAAGVVMRTLLCVLLLVPRVAPTTAGVLSSCSIINQSSL